MLPAIDWIKIGGGAGAALLVSWALHTLDVARIDAAWQKKLDNQKTELEAQCAEKVKLTEENSRDWQKKNFDLTRQLANLKRVYATACIVPVTGQTGGGDATGGIGEHARQNGVTVGPLLDYAGECEGYRLQVISLQDFIDKTWAGNK